LLLAPLLGEPEGAFAHRRPSVVRGELYSIWKSSASTRPLRSVFKTSTVSASSPGRLLGACGSPVMGVCGAFDAFSPWCARGSLRWWIHSGARSVVQSLAYGRRSGPGAAATSCARELAACAGGPPSPPTLPLQLSANDEGVRTRETHPRGSSPAIRLAPSASPGSTPE
jgi:hypothetical protein